ncbi:MAG: LpqB family beta-propeller domain-containing protein, partial [Chloroflexi bacterium]|nr:LpqB family beta-propeller domain-containing protein [Chloroflexota bacterium]
WDLPSGAAQVQVQVTPFNGDGPALNLIRNADVRLNIPAPPAWYVLLPGMTYTWRVRVTPETTPVTEADPSWSAWSSAWRFTTPAPSSMGIGASSPGDGGLVAAGAAALRWQNSAPDIFYYEIQVSLDREFRTGENAIAAVWWNLTHGAVTDPPNSWTTPPLEPGGVYFWRVRARVQGDGAPVAWSPTWSFTVEGGAAPTPTPAPSPAPSPTPTPTPAPTGMQRLAFVSTRDGTPELYVMNGDGSAPGRVTRNAAAEENPVWSPDGQRLAFDTFRDGGRGIYVIAADGTNERRLTPAGSGARLPAWSPVTARIAFVGNDGDQPISVLFSVLPDGTQQRRLDGSQGAERPVWSPVSDLLAFVSGRDGNKEIYRVGGSGGAATRLTSAAGAATDPVWSPDGRRIAFVSERDGNSELSAMNADGGSPARLTSHPASDSAPAWSPDGQRIAFLSNREGVHQIYVMGLDGAGLKRLTQSNANEGRPLWSPDGTRIAFASSRESDPEIYAMNPDGGALANLSQRSGASDTSPVWAPR